jgi:hypothetical protein
MFMITMPLDFTIGETRYCKINREPKKVTWRDKDTLVIEPGDARRITQTFADRGLQTFICSGADDRGGPAPA